MARKSLSSQVIEEVDRARGLLRPIQDITDPMTSHLIGAVLESLHRVESMCLAAMQSAMDAVVRDTLTLQDVPGEPATPRRRSGAHKAPATTRKPVSK